MMADGCDEHRLLGSNSRVLFSRVMVFKHDISEGCMCEPECVYVDPESGNEVWVHRDVGSA